MWLAHKITTYWYAHTNDVDQIVNAEWTLSTFFPKFKWNFLYFISFVIAKIFGYKHPTNPKFIKDAIEWRNA